MASMMDLLLGAGSALTDREVGEVECSRLSRLFADDLKGEPFLITIHALTTKEIDALPKGANFKQHVILEATENPDFRSSDLRKKLTPEGRKGIITPIEAIDAIFRPGEIVALYNEVMALCGFDEDNIKKK